MASVVITVLALWVTTIRSFEANNECDERYSSITREHTMCKSINENCHFLRHKGKIYAEQLLRTHNLIRNSIRKYVGKNYPLATNMKMMQWDDDLYEIARMHSLQCVEQPDCDLCHQTGYFPVEQNFAVKTYKKSEIAGNGPVKRFQTVIKEWAAELKQYDPSVVNTFTVTEELPTHWTNILRSNTSFVGCASMNFDTDEPDVFTEVYVCNYGPANLTRGEEIYKTGGKPCSDCEDYGICDEEFKNLCVRADFEIDETIVIPEEDIETWLGEGNYTGAALNEKNEGSTSSNEFTKTESAETLLYSKIGTTEETQTSIGEENSSMIFTETAPEETSIGAFATELSNELATNEVEENADRRKRKVHPLISRILRYSNKSRKRHQK